MEYGVVPGIPKRVSRLVHGAIMFNTADLGYAFDLLDAVFETGINMIDTAHVYGGGECERALGRWIAARGNRDEVAILDKGAHHNPDRPRVTPFDITADIHDSLARLRQDHIDLYLLHRDNPSVPVGPIVDVLNEHRAAGRIGAFGGSNWSHERIRAANEYAKENNMTPFVASSPQFSLATMLEPPWENCISITGPAGASARKYYAEQDMPVFAWSSIAGGFLSGQFSREQLEAGGEEVPELVKRCYTSPGNLDRLDRARDLARDRGVTLPQVALAYVLCQPMETFALMAPRTPAEAAENAGALDLRLSPEDIRWLETGER